MNDGRRIGARCVWCIIVVMPTDILRARSKAAAKGGVGDKSHGTAEERFIELKAGRIALHARLVATATADLIWAALPMFATAEPWGDAIHFEIPVFSGRDRTARLQARMGDICFWCEEQRVVIAFGPTPISRAHEMRMPAPVNVFATALDDVEVLRRVGVGEKVSLSRWVNA